MQEGKRVSKHFLTDCSYSIKIILISFLNGECGMLGMEQNAWAINLQSDN